MLFLKNYKSFDVGDWIIAGVPSPSRHWPELDFQNIPVCVQWVGDKGIAAGYPPTVKMGCPCFFTKKFLREHDFRAIPDSDPRVISAMLEPIMQ